LPEAGTRRYTDLRTTNPIFAGIPGSYTAVTQNTMIQRILALCAVSALIFLASGCSTTEQQKASASIAKVESDLNTAEADYEKAVPVVNAAAPIVAGTSNAAKLSDIESYIQTGITDAQLLQALAAPLLSGS
jgi:hypothetical protein